MKTPFSVILDRFKVLSDLENQEGEYSKNLIIGPGQGLSYGSPEHLELKNEPAPCSEALDAFLDALPPEVVHAIAALLFSGRDKQADAVEYWKTLRANFPNIADAKRAILEIESRYDYIASGIKLLPKSTALNDVPTRIAALYLDLL